MILRGRAARSSKLKGARGVVGSSLPKGTELNQEHINGGLSFKGILQGKPTTTTNLEQTQNIPSIFIVEQLNHVPELIIDLPETNDPYTTYEAQAIICRFDSLLPKPMELFHWIFSNWTTNCEVHFIPRVSS